MLMKNLKNILVILLALLAITTLYAILVSCKQNNIETSNVKEFSLQGTNHLETDGHGIVKGSDGHDYLIVNWKTHSENVEHYIDCNLCQSRKNSGDN